MPFLPLPTSSLNAKAYRDEEHLTTTPFWLNPLPPFCGGSCVMTFWLLQSAYARNADFDAYRVVVRIARSSSSSICSSSSVLNNAPAAVAFFTLLWQFKSYKMPCIKGPSTGDDMMGLQSVRHCGETLAFLQWIPFRIVQASPYSGIHLWDQHLY